tara:strand:- start:953 stop:1144 length:192 start_codon:yes stop_codon:yes gene_type:complete
MTEFYPRLNIRNMREELLKMRSRLDVLIDEAPLGHISESIASMVYDSIDKACMQLGEVLEAIE